MTVETIDYATGEVLPSLAKVAKTEADLREWRALARELQAEATA